ncbi:MAG: hypothetical protein JJE42_08055 [Burkholderiales bacterium]|nr:hypothetical protein [Burkholderiales bacterium]
MDLVFRQARLDDAAPLMDVAIAGGKIAGIGPKLECRGVTEIDAKGRVLIPGLIESHLHLEKAYVMHRRPNRSGTLMEAIAATAALKPTFTREDIAARSRRVLRQLVGFGSTHVRAHAEFDPAQGFAGFDTVLELRREFAEVIDIQVVAFPQEGILKAPGTGAIPPMIDRVGIPSVWESIAANEREALMRPLPGPRIYHPVPSMAHFLNQCF